jgi:creatinine amidohydrolase
MTVWKLIDANYGEIKSQQFEVAVLPLGATEPHNLHLPYGTDVFEATIIGEHICRAAAERGGRVVLLPTIPYGTETNLREFPLAINLNPSTLHRVIADIVDSLAQSRIPKLLLLNSHGGNDLKPLLRELFGRTPVQIFLCNWYQAIDDLSAELFEHRDDHAGEMETSFALAYFPELVARKADGSLAADAGEVRQFRFRALNEGWVSITRPWHLLTENSGAANPHAATADKGKKLMSHLVTRLGEFLVELSSSKVDDCFPFVR